MKKSMKLLGTVAALAVATVSSSAFAQSFTYSFSGDGGLNGAFGTLTGTSNGNGVYTATSGTITAFGTIASGSGTLFANPNAPGTSTSPIGVFYYDDQLSPGNTPSLTDAGLLFNIGGSEVNIFSIAGETPTFELANSNGTFVFGNFALSQAANVGAVPEPATWAMMMLGFGAVGYALRRRSKVATTVRFA